MKRYLIGKGHLENQSHYPYGVSYCPANIHKPIEIWEGIGPASQGGCFSPEQALKDKWKQHFTISRSMWFIPYIERMKKGESIELQEIIDKHESLFNRPIGTATHGESF
ncbi:MAG: hypothetical protein AAF558_10015 [Verrucomicrobiota bacterium]